VKSAGNTTHFPNITVQLEDAFVPSSVMQTIDILGDQAKIREAFLKLGHRQMARVRLDPGNHFTPPAVPFPNTRRMISEGLGSCQVFDAEFVP
jgi:hypothetical protein